MTQKLYAVINLSNVSIIDEGFYKLAKAVSTVYGDKDIAKANAVELASKSPGTQYATMEICEVYEALTPTIVTKKFNEEGELLNVPAN